MCYNKFTDVYVCIIRYSCRILMKYKFSRNALLKLYQSHFQILRVPLKQPTILQVSAKILNFSQVDDWTSQY
jgi:hypothetical protein